MKMLNQSSGSNSKLRTVQDVIRAIEKKCDDGTCIFRGEPECNKQVSSNLFRELKDVKAKYSDIKHVQAEIVAAVKAYTKAYTDKTDDYEILTDLQHYGGKTNLIDFTTDYNVALFFACYGAPSEDGRIIILQETKEIRELLSRPQTPEIRVSAQKSVFVEPSKGYIEQRYEEICIPRDLKLLILQHLREALEHEISPRTIYNDIHGFIRSHNDNWIANRNFYSGLASQNQVDETTTLDEKHEVLKKTIEHYTNALEQNLQLPGIYNNRGNAYNDLNEHEMAIADFNAAIELKPDYAGAYSNRANAYTNIGDVDRAIADLDKAIDLKPDDARVFYNRGNAYKSKNDFDHAISDFNAAIRLKPDFAEAHNNRGIVYNDGAKQDLAIADFRKAIDLKPDYAEAYSSRGTSYYEKNNVDDAIVDYTKAIELKPNYTEAYNNRGLAYVKKGKVDDAIVDLSKAIDLNPNYADAYRNRGDAYNEKK